MLNRLLHPFGRKPKPPRPPVEPTAARTQAAVIDVTDGDFASVVLASDKVAVVDFWAEWCEPCQIMAAYMGFLAQELGDQLLLAALDVDENPATPAQYNVMGLPTLLVLKDGQEVDRIVGFRDYEEIKRRIEAWIEARAKSTEEDHGNADHHAVNRSLRWRKPCPWRNLPSGMSMAYLCRPGLCS